MDKYQKALQKFEAKAKLIVHKYTDPQGLQSAKYSYLRLSGFFGNFNTTLLQLDEELHRETSGILHKFIDNDQVDFTSLLDGLHQKRMSAKMEYIKNQQPGYIARRGINTGGSF